MTIFDHFRAAGRIGRGIFSLCVLAATDKKTISDPNVSNVLDALIWFKPGQLVTFDGGKYNIGAWKSVEQFFTSQSPAHPIRNEGMVMLLGYQLVRLADNGPLMPLWHIFHLNHQTKYWVLANFKGTPDTLKERIVKGLDYLEKRLDEYPLNKIP